MVGINFEPRMGEIYEVFTAENSYSPRRDYIGRGLVTKIIQGRKVIEPVVLLRNGSEAVCYSFKRGFTEGSNLVMLDHSEIPLDEHQKDISLKLLGRRQI